MTAIFAARPSVLLWMDALRIEQLQRKCKLQRQASDGAVKNATAAKRFGPGHVGLLARQRGRGRHSPTNDTCTTAPTFDRALGNQSLEYMSLETTPPRRHVTLYWFSENMTVEYCD